MVHFLLNIRFTFKVLKEFYNDRTVKSINRHKRNLKHIE
jgi:hypothetical protein